MASLGAGDDLFVWNPGDGSDTVDGRAGVDTLSSVAPPATRSINIAAHGSHVSLTRRSAL